MAARIDTSPTALMAARKRDPKVKAGKGSGMTPRVIAGVEFFVWGWDGAPDQIDYEAAAHRAGLKTGRALREALKRPAVAEFFRKEMQALRLGERPANLRKLKAIRDDADLSKSAAGARAQIAAIAEMHTDPDARSSGELTVNTSVNLAVETAGYVIRLPARSDSADHQIRHLPQDKANPLIEHDHVPKPK